MNEWEWQLLEDKSPLDCIVIGGAEVRTGDRVRLHPRKGGDILDIALRDQIATIAGLEQDYEGKTHVCVVLDNDPGRDLGLLRQPGHQFFFDSSEVEPLPRDEQSPHIPSQDVASPDMRSQDGRRGDEEGQKSASNTGGILIAGIGNIFSGDDGFGVEVVRRLATQSFPASVRVADFGIRGLDLAYALQDGYETIILIDAFPHGEAPGTVYVVEPDLNDPAAPVAGESFFEPHAMNPMNVLRMVAAIHGPLRQVLLVGCEPESLGGEEGHMGLSPAVEIAVEEAVRIVHRLTEKALNESHLKSMN